MKRIGKVGLLSQILIAFVVVIIAGVIFGPSIGIVEPLGILFLRLIQFIIIPLIVSSLVVGVASTGDMQTLGRIGGKTMVYYLTTTLIAVTIDVMAGGLFMRGAGVDVSTTAENPEATETAVGVNVLLE